MDFHQATLATCSTATGIVVSIDVLRAFTTAALALEKGVSEIILVSTVEEAFAWRDRLPGSLVMGEVDGFPVKGFDFDNSPWRLDKENLAGKRLIQRTTAGTQGVVRSVKAGLLMASSFVCASATARYIQSKPAQQMTFVITGTAHGRIVENPPPGLGDEDAACADYLEALLRGEHPDPTPYLERVVHSPSGQKFAAATHPDLPPEDLDYCTAIDRFNFAMVVSRRTSCLVLNRVDI